MNNIIILSESRISDFREKYNSIYSDEQINYIVKNFKGKFLNWIGKNLSPDNFDSKINDLGELLNKFEKFSSNLPIKDIYSYKSIDQLKTAISEYENRQRRNVQKIEGANVVYDDKERFILINPLTHKSSCYYGSGTKWCTTAMGDQHFHNYNNDGKLFYLIDKKLPSNNRFYKVAIYLKYNGDVAYYDSNDKLFSSGWIFNTENFEKISEAISNYMTKNFSELIDIYEDEIKLKKERERLDRVNRNRIQRQRELEIERRREDNEWDLDGDISKVGLMAWATLRFIKNNLDFDLPNDFSVYNIFPKHTYFEMTVFTVYGFDDLESYEFIVGDENDTHETALNLLDELYDDIGIDSINRYFLEDNLDVERIVSFASEFYNDIIYDDPDSYFDESDRELSKEQELKKEINERKIEQYLRSINELREQIKKGVNSERLSLKVKEFQEVVEELEDEITEMEENPEGDYPDDIIEDKIDEMIKSVRHDPLDFLKEFDISIAEYVDRDSLFNSIIEHDGYDNIVNLYDGYLDIIGVNGEYFYVGRIE